MPRLTVGRCRHRVRIPVAGLGGAVKRRTALTSAIYAGTSALILAPMLWELTLRFNVCPLLPPRWWSAFLAASLTVFAPAAFTPRDLKPVVRVASPLQPRSRWRSPSLRTCFCPFVRASDSRRGLRVCSRMRSRARSRSDRRAGRRRSHLDSDFRLFRRTEWSRGLPGTEPRRTARSRHRGVCPVCGERGRQNGSSRAAHRSFRHHSSRPCVSARFSKPGGFRSAARNGNLGVVCLALSPVCYVMVFTVFARAPDRRNRPSLPGGARRCSSPGASCVCRR